MYQFDVSVVGSSAEELLARDFEYERRRMTVSSCTARRNFPLSLALKRGDFAHVNPGQRLRLPEPFRFVKRDDCFGLADSDGGVFEKNRGSSPPEATTVWT